MVSMMSMYVKQNAIKQTFNASSRNKLPIYSNSVPAKGKFKLIFFGA